MKITKVVLLAVALLSGASATSYSQVVVGGGGGGGGGGGVARGTGGGGGGAGGGGIVVMGVGRGAGGSTMMGGVPVSTVLMSLFTGTSAASDSILIAQAVKIDAKYAAEIRLGRVTRAGPPADSLVAKARLATASRNTELKALLKNDSDKKKFEENLTALTAGRGGH